MKVAILTHDNREFRRDYTKKTPDFGTAPEGLLEGFALIKECEVHVISCLQEPVESPAKLAENIWYHSLHVPKTGWLRTGYQGCIRAVRRQLASIQPDLVHGQGTERDCALSAIYSGYPNVLTIHGNMRLIARVNRARPLSFEWLAARLEGWTLPRTRGVICISEYTRRAVKDAAPRTWLVPNAVDGTFFHLERSGSAPPVVLCIGHVTVRKNQNLLLHALTPLAERLAFRVRFFGAADPKEPYAAEFFELLKTRPWAEYAGYVDRPTLRREFVTGDALILPSLEDNCPMVVLEAMAAGVPVIAPEVGGVPEIIQHKRNGLLCDPLSEESLRRSVETILTDGALRGRLVEHARRTAAERYHPRSIAERHVEIYRELLGMSDSGVGGGLVREG